jgi:hypothetical protein
MKFLAIVHTPMYDHNDKKYIRLVIPEKYAVFIQRKHTKEVRDNPLDGRILTVKVPFRYRRVMCVVRGEPIQSLVTGCKVEVEVDFCGFWNIGNYSGYSWKLTQISSSSNNF